MALQQDDAENFYIVRRFSEIVRDEMADEPLSQGLAIRVDADAAREHKGKYYVDGAIKGLLGDDASDPKFYESICGTKLAELEVKSIELEVTWVKFQKKFKVVDGNGGGSDITSKPDLGVVRSAIQTAQTQMEKREGTTVGKFKSFFGRSAQSMDNHNYLFALLPSGDKYTSVFTGAFSAIVNATVTHDKIASEISDSFDDISDHVRSFYFVIKDHPHSAYIKYHIALFYFELFNFLTCIMREWYQTSLKRISKSFGNSFLENTVQGTLKILTQYTERIKAEDVRIKAEDVRKTKAHHTAQLNTLGMMVQNNLMAQAKTQKVLDSIQNDYSNLLAFVKREIPAQKVEGLLRGSMAPPPRPLQAIEPQYRPELSISQHTLPAWTRSAILTSSEHLKPNLQSPLDITKLINRSKSLQVNTEISTRIHKWLTSPSSEALWIEGPYSVPKPSQSTLTSAFILGNLRRVYIDGLVEFCQYDAKYWRTWDNEEEFLKVVYALVYQACNALPETLEPTFTTFDFSSLRFAKLDGNVKTLPEAVDLLRDLIAVGPSLQFCLVDGLQIFGRHTSRLLREGVKQLVDALCEAVKVTKGSERVLKVLFTTDGLLKELAEPVKKGLLGKEVYDKEEEEELLSVKDIELVN